jgi:hypothetical protein
MPIILDDVVSIDVHTPAKDTQRDRWGRYLIPDPDTGKARGWTRATTVAKTLDDASNLTAWAKRTVARGVAARSSLAAGIIAAGEDKRALDALVEQAMEAAGGNERRELGTHLHRILELVDLGRMAVDDVPDPFRGDVAAYRAALDAHGLEVVPQWCEAVLLNRPLEIAGTCDRILRDRTGQLVVADIKTGTYVSWLAFACQFAIYATSTHTWDPSGGALAPAPDMRQDHALMLHVPAGEARCDIQALSVPVGMEAALMALEVRRLRATDKAKHVVVDGWDAAPAPAKKTRTVNHQWGTAAVKVVTARPTVTDEGPSMTPAQMAELRKRAAEIDPQARALLDTLAKSAAGVGKPWSIGAGPQLRRWHLYRALLRLATHFGANLAEDHVRATVAVVLPEAGQPAVPLGPAIGSLTLDEAQALVRAALAVIAADTAASIQTDDTGAIAWHGVDTTAA